MSTNPSPVTSAPQPVSAVPLSGNLAESIPWSGATGTVTPTSGDLFIWACQVIAGKSYGHSGFVAAAAGTALSHWWTCMLDNTYAVRAVTADQLAANPAAGWNILAHTAPWVPSYTGLAYLGVMLGGTGIPALVAGGTPGGTLLTGAPTPLAGGQSSTGQSTPPALATVQTAPTTTVPTVYMFARA